jgi:hypothetical protein
MILWNYINFNTYLFKIIYIYKPMVMYIAIIFNELCFECEFKNSKILIVKYENVHKLLEAMREFVWIWKLCEGQVVM